MERRVFDEKKLTERKNNNSGFRSCPLCGAPLKKQMIDSILRLQCSNSACDYIYFHNPIPAAGAMIINDGKILLVKRAREPKQGWWCIPAGFMEWTEHPSETAIREVEEETGLKVKLDSLFEVYSGTDDPRTNAILIVYLATVIEGTPRAGDDADEVGYFSFDALPEKIAFVSNRQALADYRRRFLEKDSRKV